MKVFAVAVACDAALVLVNSAVPPQADAATSSQPHRPYIVHASVGGKAQAYTVKVKVGKVKVKRCWGAVVRVQSKGMKTRTAKVGKKKVVTLKKVRAKAGSKIKVSVRAWHKARGKKKAWSKRSKTVRLTAPASSSTSSASTGSSTSTESSNSQVRDTSHFTITIVAASGATGYQVRYADNASFDNANVVDVDHAGEVTLEGIHGVVNYISVRSVYESGDTTTYSDWSKTVTADLS
ncbi:MAG: hypothetical protein ACOX69_03265 [Coriobacteriales bacterium]